MGIACAMLSAVWPAMPMIEPRKKSLTARLVKLMLMGIMNGIGMRSCIPRRIAT